MSAIGIDESLVTEESRPDVSPAEAKADHPVFLLVGDARFRHVQGTTLRARDIEVIDAAGTEGVIDALHSSEPTGAVVELKRGATASVTVIEELRRVRPGLPLVVASHQPSVAEAVKIMQLGAEFYVPLTDPAGRVHQGVSSSSELVEAVQSILNRRRTVARIDRTPRLSALVAEHGLIGESPAMKALFQDVALVAPTRTTVLVLGETGTGKERISQAIHQASPRRNAAFVAVNCAALSETLLESELFGHEKGAFSGAHCRREGRFKIADGGTIFLDEIGEISPALQVKLLRVLQERQLERVGGSAPVSVDVRVIAATNRNLRQMVADNTFRADLFYRLNVMVLHVPALRERSGDLPPLIGHILARLSFDLGIPKPDIGPEIMRRLVEFDWPGNVRELENTLERLLILSQGRAITLADLPAELRRGAASAAVGRSGGSATGGAAAGAPIIPGATFREIERHAILTTYEACGRSPSRTAEILGLSLRTVHYRLREYRGEVGRRTRGMEPFLRTSAAANDGVPIQSSSDGR